MSRRYTKRTTETMTSIARAVAFVAAVAVSFATAAEKGPSPRKDISGRVGTHVAKDWAQARLSPEADLRQQIEATKAFLDESTPGINKEVSRLKMEGILDRRSSSKIRNALDHARHSITGVAESIEAGEQIDGWTARMISYELGMAADALAKQAHPIEEAALSARQKDDGSGSEGTSPEGKQQRQLARTLRESSKLLKGTAQAIVRHLD